MSLLEKDKRKFSVIIGSKKCGVCSGASPSGAAKKVKGKSGEFYLKETTKGSKKKLYGPYSSKKKIVQRGGEEKNLRENICNTVLEILRNCDKLRPVDEEMNVKYGILKNAYLFLGITHRTDKCDSLQTIIRIRDDYTIQNKEGVFPLCYCLCVLSEKEQNIVETNFCLEFELIINKRLNKSKDFYSDHWLRFINFLRNIIQKIEYDTLLNVEKTSKTLKGIRKELNEEENKYFDNLRREIKESREFHAAQSGPAQEPNSNNRRSRGFAQAGPAEEKLNFNQLNNPLNNPLLQIKYQGRRRNYNPNQPPHNSQIPQTNMSNLIARLAALNKN